MIIGMFIALAGFVCSGLSMSGILVAWMIFVFSIGEILCSPKFTEYIGMTAPPDKKAIYLGYSNIPFAIGWALGNLFSGPLYDEFSSKVNLGRLYLVEKLSMAESFVMDSVSLPSKLVMNTMAARVGGASVGDTSGILTEAAGKLKGIEELRDSGALVEEEAKARIEEVIDQTAESLQALSPGTEVEEATRILWETYHPWVIWILLGVVGFASLLWMWTSYIRLLRKEKEIAV